LVSLGLRRLPRAYIVVGRTRALRTLFAAAMCVSGRALEPVEPVVAGVEAGDGFGQPGSGVL